MMQYDFKDAFNRFREEVEKTTNEKIKDIQQTDCDLSKIIDAQIREMGHLVIKTLDDYHNSLMQYLKEKGIE